MNDIVNMVKKIVARPRTIDLLNGCACKENRRMFIIAYAIYTT